jgi:transcriptional regulator with XRE-family HTH domain
VSECAVLAHAIRVAAHIDDVAVMHQTIDQGRSQADLAERVGLHYGHVGRYERGQSRPSADAAQKLADALGVTTEFLIEGTGEETTARERFTDRELLKQFQEVEQLPERDKQVVKTLLEAFLLKQQIQSLAAAR